MKLQLEFIRATACLKKISAFWAVIILIPLMVVSAADNEFTGKFEPQLAPNNDDYEHVIFKPFDASSLQLPQQLERDAKVTAARLLHPPTEKQAMWAILVEPEGESPYIYVDGNLDGAIAKTERYELAQGEEKNPYILETVASVELKGSPFATMPIKLQYFRRIKTDEMQEGERLVLQTTEVFARGVVDIQGKKTLVQYAFNPKSKKLSPTIGKLGVDGDGDGKIDLDRFSPEVAEAREETIIFRVGDVYVSTKKADLEKNQIVLRSHPASDYKRVELRMGGEIPDFAFTDFKGKKRKVSEFRGKYLLIDFWGTWCGPCRREMPYLKSAYRNFQPRGLEILGMNTDEPEIISDVKNWLAKNGLEWPQATRESIREVIRGFRIHSYPTTILLDPDGKIISLNQTKQGQPSLRGNDLLKSLNKLLPR
ncbi:MAG: redoxin domain-containing protein [Acidobacteriota bacterium]|nr:redoxin domain-containing protein [Acidobacteriota bacterium]